ncbi:Mss4-like protein [Aspergillus californicus]
MPDLTGNPNVHDPSQFTESLTGSCLCGSIKVTIHDRELFTKRRGHICHCSNCRKVSGSYAAANLIIEEEKVEIEDQQGTLTKFVDTQTGSGTLLDRYFCQRCGK